MMLQTGLLGYWSAESGGAGGHHSEGTEARNGFKPHRSLRPVRFFGCWVGLLQVFWLLGRVATANEEISEWGRGGYSLVPQSVVAFWGVQFTPQTTSLFTHKWRVGYN